LVLCDSREISEVYNNQKVILKSIVTIFERVLIPRRILKSAEVLGTQFSKLPSHEYLA
jgi:hypothetical protein